MQVQSLILENLTAFRGLLFLCCVGYWWILYGWVRPSTQAIKYGALASLVQFWLGLLLDIGYVKLGLWQYRPMPFALAGVPLDLHLDWALLWGFGLVWLGDRILGRNPGMRQVGLFVGAWTLFTLAFDAAMVDWMIFLETMHPLWWLADILFLTLIQGFTLWFYRSIGLAGETSCGLGALPPIRPYPRALIYMSFAIPFFFIFIPDQIEAAALALGFQTGSISLPLIPWFLVFLATVWGGWATHEFARRGQGTPIPWDPPRYFVTSGPYAITANPMQQSGLLLTLAVLLARPSWVMAGFLADVVVMAVIVFTLFEVRGLHACFQPVYEIYRARIKPWRFNLEPYRYQEAEQPVIFYDDECGLCRIVLQLLLALDYRQTFRVSPLSGATAKAMSFPAGHGSRGDTLIFWEPGLSRDDPGLISVRARAILRALGYASLPISLLAAFEGIPGVTLLGDQLYRLVAILRYRLWPSSADRCLLCSSLQSRQPSSSYEGYLDSPD